MSAARTATRGQKARAKRLLHDVLRCEIRIVDVREIVMGARVELVNGWEILVPSPDGEWIIYGKRNF